MTYGKVRIQDTDTILNAFEYAIHEFFVFQQCLLCPFTAGNIHDVADDPDNSVAFHHRFGESSNPYSTTGCCGERKFKVVCFSFLGTLLKSVQNDRPIFRLITFQPLVNVFRRSVCKLPGIQIVDSINLICPKHGLFYCIPFPATDLAELLCGVQKCYALSQRLLRPFVLSLGFF